MSRARGAIVPTVLASCVLLISANGPSTAASADEFRAKVRLYSNGQVVGTWEASAPARMESGTLVFPIEDGFREREVRISGTFSYEVLPR